MADWLPSLAFYFNSLPHTEVDTRALWKNQKMWSFQLTTSHRGRPAFQPHASCVGYFNSLPHTEVDSASTTHYTSHRYFNSLPHTEVDSNLSQNSERTSMNHITNRTINLYFFSFQASYNNYKTQKSSLFLVRISQRNYVYFTFALQNQCPCNIKSRMCSYVFYFIFVIISQVIKPQTVDFFIYDFLKNIFYLPALCCVHLTLKYWILNSLSIIRTFFGNFS